MTLLSALGAHASTQSMYNAATGGTSTTDISNYNGTGQTWRVHIFLGNGTFNVTSASKQFRILVVGGGGGASHGTAAIIGNSGNGGFGSDTTTATLTVQAYSVTVGGGGGGSGSYYVAGSTGGTSTISSYTANGGTGGIAINPGPSNQNGANNGPTSSITNTSVAYGRGGSNGSGTGASNTGNGAGGRAQDAGGYNGGSGIVVISYRIG